MTTAVLGRRALAALLLLALLLAPSAARAESASPAQVAEMAKAMGPMLPIPVPWGVESLAAALNPAKTDALYFVARGDGTSQFSTNLNDHNRAVNQYQRGGRSQ